ncbi:hypothetical protein Q3G72_000940 [Acer saccharum]|nr:hypothetical protein Q3G72_000940 [Acer saccharum]
MHVGGTIADKRATEAYDILEKIVQNSQQWTSHVRKGGRLDVGPNTQVQIQMSQMNKELQFIKYLITGKPGSSHGDNSFKALKNTLHALEQRMTDYMQFNDQRANSHGVSLKKMETQLAQLLDAVVKQNKGKSPSTDEHINVLEVVEEEVEKVVRPEIIPNQVRVLDHSTKVDVDNVVKGTKNEERENGEISPLN